MVVAAIILSGLLIVFPVIVIVRETKDRVIKGFSIVTIIIGVILVGLQIFLAINEAKYKKAQKDNYLILLSKTINEEEIYRKEREMVNSDGMLNSWPMVASENPATGQAKLNIQLIGIHKLGAFKYILIYTDIKGAPELYPMVRATKHDNRDINWYIAFVLIPPYIMGKNPELTIIAKFENGYYDIKEYKLKDIIVKWGMFLPLDLKNAMEYNNRGVGNANKDEFNQAINNFNIATQLNPNSAMAYKNRAIIWIKKGKFDLAINDCNTAIQISSDYADAFYNRGVAHDDKAEYTLAMADYNTVIQIDPNYAEAYYNRGNLWVRKGELDKAIADYNIVIHINPNKAEAYHNRGLAYYDKSDFDQAIADSNMAIRLNPNYAEAYYNLARATILLKGPKDVCKWLRKAIELKEEFKENAKKEPVFHVLQENDCF